MPRSFSFFFFFLHDYYSLVFFFLASQLFLAYNALLSYERGVGERGEGSARASTRYLPSVFTDRVLGLSNTPHWLAIRSGAREPSETRAERLRVIAGARARSLTVATLENFCLCTREIGNGTNGEGERARVFNWRYCISCNAGINKVVVKGKGEIIVNTNSIKNRRGGGQRNNNDEIIYVCRLHSSCCSTRRRWRRRQRRQRCAATAQKTAQKIAKRKQLAERQ